jgi:hypothetical protein
MLSNRKLGTDMHGVSIHKGDMVRFKRHTLNGDRLTRAEVVGSSFGRIILTTAREEDYVVKPNDIAVIEGRVQL